MARKTLNDAEVELTAAGVTVESLLEEEKKLKRVYQAAQG